MNRVTIFQAVRAAARPNLFADPGNVLALDNLLDAFDVPRDQKPQSGEQLRASPKAVRLIHSSEDCELTAYKDPGSDDGLPITIGWGSTTDENGKPIKLGDVWSQERADTRFAMDLAKFEADVRSMIGSAPTTQNQFDALVSFTYNLGKGNVSGSTLMAKHKAGDYAAAKANFAKWIYNDGKVMKGLIRRRAAEAALYAS